MLFSNCKLESRMPSHVTQECEIEHAIFETVLGSLKCHLKREIFDASFGFVLGMGLGR